MVAIGDRAPDFALPGTDGTPEGHRTYELSEYRGTPVVLVFYPGDHTPVCTRQLAEYSADLGAFADVGAQVLAISPQDVESHDGFAAELGGVGFPLLADVDKSVGRDYGILGPIGFYRRSVFIVSADGLVTWSHRAVSGLGYRSSTELIEAVRRAG